jgi:hypothetical protein
MRLRRHLLDLSRATALGHFNDFRVFHECGGADWGIRPWPEKVRLESRKAQGDLMALCLIIPDRQVQAAVCRFVVECDAVAAAHNEAQAEKAQAGTVAAFRDIEARVGLL